MGPVVHEVVRRAVDPAGIPSSRRRLTCFRSRVSIPQRSQPDKAKTPGCSALNIASSRCACLICSTCSGLSLVMLVMPNDAAMIVAVVDAMPFWVKVALYGAALPVR